MQFRWQFPVSQKPQRLCFPIVTRRRRMFGFHVSVFNPNNRFKKSRVVPLHFRFRTQNQYPVFRVVPEILAVKPQLRSTVASDGFRLAVDSRWPEYLQHFTAMRRMAIGVWMVHFISPCTDSLLWNNHPPYAVGVTCFEGDRRRVSKYPQTLTVFASMQ